MGWSELRPTRRGIVVVAIAAVAILLAFGSGVRSLHAVSVTALLGMVVGAGQLRLAGRPTIERDEPEAGFPGERRTVTVTVDSKVPVTVDERVGRGVAVVEWPDETPLGHGGTFSYTIELQRRGRRNLGPASCEQSDSLGLFVRRVRPDETATVLVYPTIHPIDGRTVTGVVERRLGSGRGSFDRLREYTGSDTMRDIHWRASAKRPPDEFVVTEHRRHVDDDRVRIVAEADDDSVDEMASAVASLAQYLEESGIGVVVDLPKESIRSDPGRRERLLRALALTDGGSVDTDHGRGAEITVRGEAGRATITVADGDVDFETLVTERRGVVA